MHVLVGSLFLLSIFYWSDFASSIYDETIALGRGG
jgi:hypothetical protein